jgi:hypothetical protein
VSRARKPEQGVGCKASAPVRDCVKTLLLWTLQTHGLAQHGALYASQSLCLVQPLLDIHQRCPLHHTQYSAKSRHPPGHANDSGPPHEEGARVPPPLHRPQRCSPRSCAASCPPADLAPAAPAPPAGAHPPNGGGAAPLCCACPPACSHRLGQLTSPHSGGAAPVRPSRSGR